MKKFLFYHLSVFLFIFSILNSEAQTLQIKNHYDIIPQPAKLVPQTGRFRISSNTLIIVPFLNEELKKLAESLANQINTASGLNIKLRNVNKMALPPGNHIFFMPAKDTTLGKEGYKLEIKPNILTIEAKDEQGFFYGIQTILQLMPPEVFSPKKIVLADWSIPCVSINDVPRYVYRGLHLDVARHFFPVSYIKRYIDLLAFHKLNIFHWHLTEDQGWRIEIKKYPKLTEVGSKRKETLIGRAHSDNPVFDGKEYGGFYTQEEIKEVVKYAQSKYVTIIPEIEMPGHALAALSAYPEYSCDPSKTYEAATEWGVFKDIFCPTEQTFHFLEDVLSEVIELFPGTYVHIGGDEAPKDAWKKSQFCQDLIKKQRLKDEHELQSYFITRIDKFLTSKGKKMIGWDEILEGGLSPNATVMSWRGISGGIAAAKEFHDVIMSPTTNLYLDYYQDDFSIEPLAIAVHLPLEDVYAYEPTPSDSLDEEQTKHILGAQANVWTEYITTTEHLEYMVYPRASALSEVVWSTKKSRNWNSFSQRLPAHFKRLDYLGVHYAKSFYTVKINPTVGSSGNIILSLNTSDKSSQIRYTIDGKTPVITSALYTIPIVLTKNITIKAGTFKNGKLMGKIISKDYVVNKATGKSYTLTNEPKRYTGGTKFALTDGIKATALDQWVGIDGKDLEMVIDLKKSEEINQVSTSFYIVKSNRIFPPLTFEVSVSEDGKIFSEPKIVKIDPDTKNEIENSMISMDKSQGRYVKIKAKNTGLGTKGYPSEGKPVFLFLDEICVE